MPKKLGPLFALLVLLIAPLARGGETVTIEVPLFEGGAGKTFFLLAAREYEKVRPGVILDLYLDPRIADKVQVRILEGSFFEITNAQTINYWPLIRNGDVVKLDQALDGPSWDSVDAAGRTVKWRDTFLPGALDRLSENGHIYGIPFGYYAQVIWYNKKLFREHGWTTPRTWDELFALCEKIKQADIPPMAFQGRYPYYARGFYEGAYYHLAGARQWQAKQLLAPGTIDSAAGIEAIRLTREVAQKYFQPGALGMSHTESQLQFFLGKTAMIPCGAWMMSEMKGKVPDDFEVGAFRMPLAETGKADPSAVQVYVEPFVVMSKSRHPEIAIDFLRFMTSQKMAGLFARMQDIPTSVRGANEGNLSRDMADVVRIVGEAKASFGVMTGEGFPEMEQEFNDMMYETIAGTTPPADLARRYEAKGQNLRQRTLHPDSIEVRHRFKPALLLGLLGLGAIWWIGRTARDLRRRSAGVLPQAGLQRMGWGNVLLFVGPAVVIYTTFVIVPSFRSLSWSLHHWNGLTDMARMPFVGLLNFKRLLLESDAFWIALNNNLFLMFVVPLFVIPLAMFLAASISRGVRGATLFRVVFFFPNLLGGVAATLLWLHLYNPQGGLVNTALTSIGLSRFNSFAWLESKNLYWALIPISIWGACGFNMVLYLAAMETIPESYYEAATLDGASRWRQYWSITLPLIWDVLAISIVFLVIGGMKAFEIIWLLTNQRPQTDNHVIATRMVQTMFNEFKVGEATAIAVLLFLMVFVGSAATMRGLRRETVEM
ncbi:MAG: extracellular solute-binding protein [Tepidisphaeraceae bacterium]